MPKIQSAIFKIEKINPKDLIVIQVLEDELRHKRMLGD